MTSTIRILLIMLLALLTPALAGCDGREDLRTQRVPLPPPISNTTPPPQPPPQPSQAQEPSRPDSQRAEAINPPSTQKPVAEPVVEGTAAERWSWELDPESFRASAAIDGPIVVLQARNALSTNYQLVRYAYSSGQWTQVRGGVPDDVSLDCRVITPSWGAIYQDLPKLPSPDDRWLVAFPLRSMAQVSDLRQQTEAVNGQLRVLLRRSGGRLLMIFRDADGAPLAEPVLIQR